jgi:hypothetical protein
VERGAIVLLSDLLERVSGEVVGYFYGEAGRKPDLAAAHAVSKVHAAASTVKRRISRFAEDYFLGCSDAGLSLTCPHSQHFRTTKPSGTGAR